jgi:hypothetical protein
MLGDGIMRYASSIRILLSIFPSVPSKYQRVFLSKPVQLNLISAFQVNHIGIFNMGFSSFTHSLEETMHSTADSIHKHREEISTVSTVAGAAGLAMAASFEVLEDNDEDTVGEAIAATGEAADIAVRTFVAEKRALEALMGNNDSKSKQKFNAAGGDVHQDAGSKVGSLPVQQEK